MQARSFGAILFSFGSVLDSGNTSHRVEDFGHGSALAVADMFELVGEIGLVQGIGLGFVNSTVKILDLRPALSLRDGSIADRGGGVLPLPAVVLQIVGENLEIILALDISQVGCQTIPSQSPGIVGLNALSELIHPAQLVFRIAVTLRGSFVKPGHRLHIVGFHAGAMLKDIADVFLSLVAAVFCSLVKPGKSFVVTLWLAPSFFGHVPQLIFRVRVAVAGGAAIPSHELGHNHA